MNAGDYALAIDGIRLLTRHELDPKSPSWDYRVLQNFPPASARALFEQLPSDCAITFLDPAKEDESLLTIRRDGEHLLLKRVPAPKTGSAWQQIEWDDALNQFQASPYVARPQSGVTSFTITQRVAVPPKKASKAAAPVRNNNASFTIFIVALVVLLISCAWYVMGPGGDGVVSYLKLPDDTECLVTQQWNGWKRFDESYNVNFYFRPPGGAWGLCEIDNGANRWPASEMLFDAKTQVLTIYHGNVRHAELNLPARRFIYLNKFGLSERETDAPQFYAAPPFPPPDTAP